MYAMPQKQETRMDPPDHAGEQPPLDEYVFDLDLRGRTPTEVLHRLSYLRPEGFTALLKAVAQKDYALQDTLLRRWGVWR